MKLLVIGEDKQIAYLDAAKFKGADGVDGLPGRDGKDGRTITGPQGPVGMRGADGKDGVSLIGERGLQGERGERGADGRDGISLMGPAGADGKDGRDAQFPTDGKSGDQLIYTPDGPRWANLQPETVFAGPGNRTKFSNIFSRLNSLEHGGGGGGVTSAWVQNNFVASVDAASTYALKATTWATSLWITQNFQPVGNYAPAGAYANSVDVSSFYALKTSIPDVSAKANSTDVASFYALKTSIPSVAGFANSTDVASFYALKTSAAGGYASGTLAALVVNKVKGIAGGGAAAAGDSGEILSQTVLASSPISMTNGAAITIATLTLTPGVWAVSANGSTALASAANTAQLVSSITQTANTLAPTDDGRFYQNYSVSGQTMSVINPIQIISVLANTAIFFVMRASFSGTLSGCGTLIAVRL